MNLSACPYHGPIFENPAGSEVRGRGFTPMDRFLAEGVSEQYALFNRPDAKELSTSKRCICKSDEVIRQEDIY
jgi:hypothetical protein